MFTFTFNYNLLGLPLASASEVLFLRKLVEFYSRDSNPKVTDDVDDFVYDSGTSEVIVTTCKGMLCLYLLVVNLCILLLLTYICAW